MILNVARLVESKGIENFIKAAPIVKRKYPRTVFIVCGDGQKKEELQKIIAEFNLNDDFFLLGGIGKELIKYYKAADLFVHVPKSGNHFGVVYLEAMAAGLPIIAADKDATPYTVGDAALLVSIENPEELSKAIIKLMTDNKLRKKPSENSIRRVEKEFNWNYIIPKIENLFEKAMKD